MIAGEIRRSIPPGLQAPEQRARSGQWLSMNPSPARKQLAREAKAIVALAFRNGPIEDLHAGARCPACGGQPGYSRITDEEMKAIMKNAVNHVYRLLSLKADDPVRYESQIEFGSRYTVQWDEPDTRQFK